MFLKPVKIEKKLNKSEFLKFSKIKEKKELLKLAKDLRDQKIVHINATAQGGGVAEILNSLIPYCKAMGVSASWYVIDPKIGGNFFETTNKFFAGLQGAKVNIKSLDFLEYKEKSQILAKEIDKLKADILIINDTQPLLAGFLAKKSKKIFYSHVDSSNPDKKLWNKLLPYFKDYKKIVFSNHEFISQDKFLKKKTVIFPPAIDPLALKQKKVAKKIARLYLKEEGKIPLNGPLIVQVSRFDDFKNPIGLIKAFSILLEKYKNAQLALVGFNVAKDNPASKLSFLRTKISAKGVKNTHLFYEPKNKNVDEFTMMAQNAADIVVQNSSREGFGLTVSEAMWKGKPVIGGPASGIKKQIKHNKNGLIAYDTRDLSYYLEELLENNKKSLKLAEMGKKTVKNNFLLNRLLLDHFKLYKKI
jgi:trehalose synthase